MANARDRHPENEPRRILAVGPAGSGKTTFFRTIPGRKFAYIFDSAAMQTLAGDDIEYEEFLADVGHLAITALKSGVADKSSKRSDQASHAYQEWEADIEQKLDSGFFKNFDVIGFDSLTSFQDMAMDRVLSLNGRSGKWPEQSDWTACMNAVMRVMRALSSLNKTIYVTAHTDKVQDGENGPVINRLNVIGRLKLKLPTLFTDVFRFSVDTDTKNEPHWFVSTTSDRKNEYVRTAMRGLLPDEEVTLRDWAHPEQFGYAALLRKASLKQPTQ